MKEVYKNGVLDIPGLFLPFIVNIIMVLKVINTLANDNSL